MGMTLPERSSGRRRASIPFALAVIFASAAAADPLPLKAPLPAGREQVGTAPLAVPAPAPRPAGKKPTVPPESALPERIEEKPEPRPKADAGPPSLSKPDEAKPEAEPRLESPPRPETSAAEEAACRQRLSALGARFEERPAVSDPNGCAIPHPIVLTASGDGIGIQPGALLNCATAEALARFLTGPAEKIAKEELGFPLKSIQQASGYVCRPRNGTLKLSEHAFGNALDIASFTLSDDTQIDVDAARNPQHSQFLSKVRTAACGPFRTVLGPGSDADHAKHFHLDLAMRRNGATFCH
jgi:hypothetical protein